MRAAALDVWLHGIRIAVLTEARTRKMQLRYTDEAAQRFTNGSAVLSVALPMTASRRHPPGIVGPWLEGLLPEGEARTTMERSYEVLRGDTYGLLQAIGRDCAGAVVIQPAGEPPPLEPGRSSVTALDDDELADELAMLAQRPLGSDQFVRVSLAGQQPKLLLARTAAGGWGRPGPGSPSTHILKPQDERLLGMATNEAACVTAAGMLGLGRIDVEVERISGRDVLVVERYDRRSLPDGAIERVHQEDLCQALSLPADDSAKYQTAPDRPPRLADAAHILDVWALDGEAALIGLARAMAFNVAIGNADAHAKNLSFVHRPAGIELAPLYDVASTIQYPSIDGRDGPVPVSRSLAMRVGAATELDAVVLDDLVDEARSWGLSERNARAAVESTLAEVGGVVGTTVATFGASPMIVSATLARAASLLSGAEAGRKDPTIEAHQRARRAYHGRRNR